MLDLNEVIEFGKYVIEFGYDVFFVVILFYYLFIFEEIRDYYFDIIEVI